MFKLPAEHAAFVTRAATADNLAVFEEYIGMLGGVENDIVECFNNGGGVPYEHYPRFQKVLAEDSGQSVLSSPESIIVPLAPGLSERLEDGIRVLDIGCGRGRIMNRLAELYPASVFTVLDLSEEAIEFVRAEASAKGLSNIEFGIDDLSDLMKRLNGKVLASSRRLTQSTIRPQRLAPPNRMLHPTACRYAARRGLS